MKQLCTLILLSIFWQLTAQVPLTISQIQGTGNISAYNGNLIKTSGIVTAKYIGNGKINGFFLQDALGDGNTNTSDGIFVYTPESNISVGDKIRLQATVNEYSGRTQLINPSSITLLSNNNALPITKVVFDPANFNWEQYEGMLIEFDQTLFVNGNRNLQIYGELELGNRRKPSPTNITLPGSAEYIAQVNINNLTPIYLDDAITTNYHSPIVFADQNGTRRTGEKIDNLQAVVDYAYSKYTIYPTSLPVPFYGNPRPTAPFDLGEYNLKICGFNLEYYLTQNLGQGYGPNNQTESDRQHTKIIQAMKAIDADIYGVAEIEQGQGALTKLSDALTSATGNHYTYINDGSSINGTYTKVGYIYRTDKVLPYKNLKENNSPSPYNRKMLQAFTLKSNGEKFLLSINHLKAKSGCSSATGENADQKDGQSCYNYTRKLEATSIVNFINQNKSYYSDDDAIVMGDLNAYAQEDPIRIFTNSGYIDLHQHFYPDTSYSYVYNGETGYLDHALANASMTKQITGICAFHINADEQAVFGYDGSNYQPDMYRCSDHDPIVVGISLGETSDIGLSPFNERVKIYPTFVKKVFTIKNGEGGYVQIYSLSGIKLFEEQIQNNEQMLNPKAMGLPPGAYIVRLLGEGTIAKHIILVE
ncbi:MAG: ExeM/NucH family extracellular endonuclease [Paludibacteraceae bacterium]